MSNVIDFKESKPEVVERICSFCRTTEKKARKMFSNGREGTPQLKCICDKCVEQARQRLMQQLGREEVPA